MTIKSILVLLSLSSFAFSQEKIPDQAIKAIARSATKLEFSDLKGVYSFDHKIVILTISDSDSFSEHLVMGVLIDQHDDSIIKSGFCQTFAFSNADNIVKVSRKPLPGKELAKFLSEDWITFLRSQSMHLDRTILDGGSVSIKVWNFGSIGFQGTIQLSKMESNEQWKKWWQSLKKELGVEIKLLNLLNHYQ